LSDWISLPLSDLPIASGKSINPFEFPNEEFELYSVPSHETGRPELVKGEDIGSNKQLVSPGTVLLCKINPRINRTWIVGEAGSRRQIASTEWIAFDSCEEVDRRFLMLFMQQSDVRDYLAANASGVGGSLMRIKPATLKGVTFRMPGIKTQQKIVEKLEELLSDLDAGVAELKAAQRKLAQYRQSLLKAAVEGALTADWREAHGKPQETGADLLQRILSERRARWEQKQLAKFAEQGKTPPVGWQAKYPEPAALDLADLPHLPNGWTWATYEQVSTRVTVGHVGPMKQHYVASGVPFLRSQNVRENRFSEEGLLFIPSEFHEELSKSKLRPGDIVVVRSGSVGVSCVIPDSLEEANCSDLVLIQEPHGIVPSFGAYYLNSAAKRDVRRGQSGIALTHFNTQAVAALRISVPPMEEQKRIVEVVEENLAAIERLDLELASEFKMASAQRKNFLRAAFSGQLVPQDPNDEPARELLARIRADRASIDNSAPRRRRKTA
jgi:type I restriction enzyme S subunit